MIHKKSPYYIKDNIINDDGVGIDLGIKDLAVCSDAVKYKNINKSQKVKKLEKQKRRLQRSISRSYEKNKKGESYCKTNNVIKKTKTFDVQRRSADNFIQYQPKP